MLQKKRNDNNNNNKNTRYFNHNINQIYLHGFFMCRLLMIWCRCCYYCKITVWLHEASVRSENEAMKNWCVYSLSHSLSHHRLFISMITHSDCVCECVNVCTSGGKTATTAMGKLAKPWRAHKHTHTLMHYKCTSACVRA